MSRPAFADVGDYSRRFTDVGYWRPHVEEICRRHALVSTAPATAGMKAGNPGTNPVFIVDERWAVKLFTNMLDTPEASRVEAQTYRLLQGSGLAMAQLVASGELYEPGGPSEPGDPREIGSLWHWPYIVTTVVPGTSFGEGGPHSSADWRSAAREAAHILRSFHSCPLDARGAQGARGAQHAGGLGDHPELTPTWARFEKLLQDRRRHMLGAVGSAAPEPLASQMRDWLSADRLPYEASVTPRLLHGDLNQDHIMGLRDDSGRWRFTGVIDFGDAKAGDPLYDLVPLHFGLFGADKALLREFMDAYAPDAAFTRDFTARALDYTLLYECDVVTPGFAQHPEWREVTDLLEWARMVWDIG